MDKRTISTLTKQSTNFDPSDQNVLCIETDADLVEIATMLPSVTTIRVRSHSFTDGRIFSLGFALRRQYRFGGDLIASGDILPDQVNYLKRCGFDRVESGCEMDPTETHVLRGYQPAHYSG